MTTKLELINDMRRVAERLGRQELSRSEYIQHGRFSEYQMYDGGDTWESLCKQAGITTRRIEPVSDEEYFERLRHAVKELGRLPKVSERKRFGLNISKRRYATLAQFIETAVTAGAIDSSLISHKPDPIKESPISAPHEFMGSSSQPMNSRVVPPIPVHTRRRKWQRTGIEGFPYAPQDELGVVALFGIICSSGILNWSILELIGGRGIDAKCFDHSANREIVVELKFLLSRSSWNHSIDEIDYVVCWENRWKDFPKPVIELQSLLTKKL